MKRFTLATYIGVAAIVGMLAPPANAGIIDNFSIVFSSGDVFGTLTGTVDLPFVNVGGTGTGAASSVVLTSIPSGFGTLAGGDDVTSWADQVTDTFTVTAGVITSFEFMAVTSGSTSGDYFCINSTVGSAGSFGSWGCPGNLNELSETADIFGYNFGGASGVTFTPSGTPEPAAAGLVFFGMASLCFVARRKRRTPQTLPKTETSLEPRPRNC
jgi:hypothetical protein